MTPDALIWLTLLILAVFVPATLDWLQDRRWQRRRWPDPRPWDQLARHDRRLR